MPDAFLNLVRALLDRDVRFVGIGVWGAIGASLPPTLRR